MQVARHHHRDFVVQGLQCLEDAGHAAQRVKGAPGFLARSHTDLALAVVTETGGLEDPGKQRVGAGVHVGRGPDGRVGGDRHARRLNVGFFRQPVLCHRHGIARRRRDAGLRQAAQAVGRDVLEFRGDGRAAPRQMVKPVRVVVGGTDVLVGHPARRTGSVGIQHRHTVTHGLGGLAEHAAQLAAAQYAQPGAGRQRRRLAAA